jgi:CopG antitoxin of type II toxin-antitoxin system
MAKSKTGALPNSISIDELVEFFETHDIGEYWEQMPEADFDINIKGRKRLIALEEEIVAKVTKIAKAKKVSSEKLINAWLKEKIQKVS